MAEMYKLFPHMLYRYSLSFTPRGPGSPHTRPGRSLEQVKDDSEPWVGPMKRKGAAAR